MSEENHRICRVVLATSAVITDPSAGCPLSTSRSVQLLETEPSPLLVLSCGTVCQQTLLRVTHFHSSAQNLKHFCLGSLNRLFCFGFFLCGPCSFYREMHFSAKRGIAIVCGPSVRDVEVCFSHRLEYFKNNFRPNSLRPLLTADRNMGDLVQREHPQNWGGTGVGSGAQKPAISPKL